MTATVSVSPAAAPALVGTSRWLGRGFVNLPFDYLVIGGVLSLLVIPLVTWPSGTTTPLTGASLPVLLLLTSSAHFAASTVRLYTKPGATRELPFVTMMLPLVAMAVLVLAIGFPAVIGRHLQALYLTWSPFHYSAQAFGLAVMYCHRSGRRLSAGEKQAIWWIAMVPFARAFLGGESSGLGWFVPRAFITDLPVVPAALNALTWLLAAATFVLPVALIVERAVRRTPPIPLIVVTLLVANGIWWVILDYLDAFVWATIFHGLQYLAIAAVVHVKDRLAASGNRRGAVYHAAWFYVVSLALGYGLFYCWPYAFLLAGFGRAESMLLTVAVINVHHFIVDRYIWRLRPDAHSRQTVRPASVVATVSG